MKQGDPVAASNSRLKRAELASSFGAGLLGLGLGAMAAPYIADLALFVLVAGALMHGWACTTNTRPNAILGDRKSSG